MNQRISKTAHIKELNTEIGRLKAELNATREKNGVYIPLEHFHQQEQARAKDPNPKPPAALSRTRMVARYPCWMRMASRPIPAGARVPWAALPALRRVMHM